MDGPNGKLFSAVLRRLIDQAKARHSQLTQLGIAARCELPPETLSRYAKGDTLPNSPERVARIALECQANASEQNELINAWWADRAYLIVARDTDLQGRLTSILGLLQEHATRLQLLHDAILDMRHGESSVRECLGTMLSAVKDLSMLFPLSPQRKERDAWRDEEDDWGVPEPIDPIEYGLAVGALNPADAEALRAVRASRLAYETPQDELLQALARKAGVSPEGLRDCLQRLAEAHQTEPQQPEESATP